MNYTCMYCGAEIRGEHPHHCDKLIAHSDAVRLAVLETQLQIVTHILGDITKSINILVDLASGQNDIMELQV